MLDLLVYLLWFVIGLVVGAVLLVGAVAAFYKARLVDRSDDADELTTALEGLDDDV